MTRPCTFVFAWTVASLLSQVLAAQASVSTKAYDVRFLVETDIQYFRTRRHLPGEGTPETPTIGARSEDGAASIEAAALHKWLRQVNDAALSGDDSRSEIHLEGNLIFVTGDDAMHEKVGSWIAIFRQVLLEQVTFELHVLPASTATSGNSRVSSTEADALLRAAGPHPVFSRVMCVGRTAQLETNEQVSHVRDVDVEVAQGSTMPDPKVDQFHAGQGWELSVARARGDRLLVQIVGEETEQEGAMRPFAVSVKDARGKPEQVRINLPSIRHVSRATSAHLADGEALLFAVGDGSAPVHCLRLRRPLMIPLPSGPTGSWLAAADVAQEITSQPSPDLYLPVPGDDRPFFQEGAKSARVLDPTGLERQLRRSLGDAENARLTWMPNYLVVVDADEARRKEVQEVIDALANLVQPVTVEMRYGRLPPTEARAAVDARLDVGELAGKLSGAFLTPCLLQDGFMVLAGRQQAYVRDYEVEIAQMADVPNPVIGHVFTGISLGGRIQRATRGQFRLALEFSFAELAGEIEPFELQDSRFSPVELPRLRGIRFQAAPILDQNRWTLLHVAPLHGTNDHFAVVARVRE